jgi:hypothetical protein
MNRVWSVDGRFEGRWHQISEDTLDVATRVQWLGGDEAAAALFVWQVTRGPLPAVWFEVER